MKGLAFVTCTVAVLLIVSGVAVFAVQNLPALPTPSAVSQPSERAVWNAFASFVEQHPDRFDDTDRVYKIAQELREMGYVDSLDRVESYKAKMRPIGSGESSVSVESVVGKLRGR